MASTEEGLDESVVDTALLDDHEDDTAGDITLESGDTDPVKMSLIIQIFQVKYCTYILAKCSKIFAVNPEIHPESGDTDPGKMRS
jgi:hypothetical protein